MTIHKTGLMVAAVLAASLAGCQSDRLGRLDTARSSVPEPLEPAPAGSVTAEPLPAPTGPVAPAAEGQFPETPGGGTQVAAATPADAANAKEVTPGAVAGVWNAAVSGQSCKIATPQTKFGAGYRAGPLKCPAPLDGVKSWSASGKQLVLYDANGGTLARLYQSGATRFDGQTTSGLPLSLTR
ncbi:MAG: protease inhibitor Inh/omp19 family protein [Rhizobiaceae bacterium]